MVTHWCLIASARVVLLAVGPAAEPVLERLDPPRRAAVIMALLGLTLVGLFLITFIMVGGHWVRRLARQRPGRRSFVESKEGGTLREAIDPAVPNGKTDETVLLDTRSKDTRIDHKQI
jgi:hypothetical protein